MSTLFVRVHRDTVMKPIVRHTPCENMTTSPQRRKQEKKKNYSLLNHKGIDKGVKYNSA